MPSHRLRSFRWVCACKWNPLHVQLINYYVNWYRVANSNYYSCCGIADHDDNSAGHCHGASSVCACNKTQEKKWYTAANRNRTCTEREDVVKFSYQGFRAWCVWTVTCTIVLYHCRNVLILHTSNHYTPHFVINGSIGYGLGYNYQTIDDTPTTDSPV